MRGLKDTFRQNSTRCRQWPLAQLMETCHYQKIGTQLPKYNVQHILMCSDRQRLDIVHGVILKWQREILKWPR